MKSFQFKPLAESRYMQYLSVIIAMLSMASTGMHLTWPSPTLPKLTSPNSPIGTTITDEEGSWIASLFLLGTIPGNIFVGWFIERFGRKATLLLSAVPFTIPWIGYVFAESALALCILRFVGGIGLALVTTSAPVYIGEIADKDIRGKLGTYLTTLRLIGNLYMLCVGPFISYTALSLSCIVLPVTFLILFLFMPESPYYLVKIGKVDVARRSLVTLVNRKVNDKVIDERLDDIQKNVQHDLQSRATLWGFLSDKKYRKPLLINVALRTLQQLCGLVAIEAYTQSIIIEASGSSISPEISSIIAGVIQFPAVFIAAALVDKLGRKPLLIISSFGCALALIAEGTYFYLQNAVQTDISSISWLPTTALMMFLLMNPIGIATVPWILQGELFTIDVKGIASSITSLYGSCLAFFVVKFFQPISKQWGMYTMFWIFAAMCALGGLFVIFFVPETKGKNFAEIQETLSRQRKLEGMSPDVRKNLA